MPTFGRFIERRLSLAVVVASLLLGGCGRGDEAPLVPASSHDLPPAGSLQDDVSIFDLDLDLIDQDSRRLKLADLGGRTTVAAMVYTSCKDVCILVTEQMKAIERQLAGLDQGVRYVLFSLDPGRDTPEAMRDFARIQKLDTARWRLMAASEAGVRDLAAVLGVRYQTEEDGQIAHSAMIFVIDAAGVVRHRQVGVADGPGGIVDGVARAGRRSQGPGRP